MLIGNALKLRSYAPIMNEHSIKKKFLVIHNNHWNLPYLSSKNMLYSL